MSVAKTTSSAVSTAQPGATAGAAAHQAVAAKPSLAGAASASAAGSVPLFGGHRGGGKKRADGLPAGSPEALAADRKKNAERMAEKRAAQKTAALPAPLPSATAGGMPPASPAGDSPGALAGGASPLPAAAGGPVVPFVPWTQRLLEKPARLLTRILDRIRQADIFKRLDKVNLPVAVKDEIKKDAEWKDSAKEDFAASLADCAAIELNKRAVNAQNAHWINLGMSAGELALAHFALCDRIDKLAIAAAAEQQQPQSRGDTEGKK